MSIETTTQASRSLWHLTAGEPPRLPTLIEDQQADVCIVGAGIAGLTLAYLLGREGKSVIVLQSTVLGDGESGRTSAHLSNALDDRFSQLEKTMGREGARLAAESHARAIDTIEEIAAREAIDCEFKRVNGYLFPGRDVALQELDEEEKAAARAGLEVSRVDSAPLPFDTGQALRFGNQAQFHPLKYLFGLARAILKQGARIFAHSHASRFESENGVVVGTRAGFQVRAQHLAVTTNTPVNDWIAIHTKNYPYRSYVLGALIEKGLVPAGLYWDMEDPYHYIRIEEHDSNDVLVVGGEDHKVGQKSDPQECLQRLERWTRTRFPIKAIAYSWSGQIWEPLDGLAFIGRNVGNEKNVYIVTGDSGNGLTHGTLGGLLITDLVMGRENPWEKLYDPSRRPLSGASTFLSENANVFAQYVDWVVPKSARSPDSLERGQGGIFQKGLAKVAVFRDEDGTLHEMSAVCPHLGGIVQWNPLEKTFDCPCHGSRYSCTGRVINGPSAADLKPLKD